MGLIASLRKDLFFHLGDCRRRNQMDNAHEIKEIEELTVEELEERSAPGIIIGL